MAKRVFIAEKPSVAQEFARILKVNGRRGDGYLESEDTIVTWCVGHLVTMSYPEVYDAALKKWSLDTLPFLPEKFLYEVIPGVKKQFDTVSYLLNREDVDTIYICTDSGREGEYIYRLVDQMAQVSANKRNFVCGLIPRRKKKYYAESERQSRWLNMIILAVRLICVPKKII